MPEVDADELYNLLMQFLDDQGIHTITSKTDEMAADLCRVIEDEMGQVEKEDASGYY